MNINRIINRRCFILALVLAFFWPAQNAQALSVEWQNLSGRERIVIRLDASDGRVGSVTRSSQTNITIPFSSGSKTFAMAAPGPAKLFGGMESTRGGLGVKLKTPEFGFIVTRPSKDILHLDIYPDPLGKRWKKTAASAEVPGAQPKQPVDKPAAAAPAPTQPAPAPAVPAPQPVPMPATPTAPAPAPAITEGTAASAVNSEDPSSVFSSKIEPPQPGQTEAPPAQQPEPAISPQPFPGTAPARRVPDGSGNNPVSDGNNYKLPAWPPMEMPLSLPAPPPPPASGRIESGTAPQASLSGGGALSVFYAEPQKLARSIIWGELLPFAKVAQAASASADYDVVEAPFAYRAKLNVNEEPHWVEQPVPVLVRVPKGTVFDIKADVVPAPGTQNSGGMEGTRPAPPPPVNDSAMPLSQPGNQPQQPGVTALESGLPVGKQQGEAAVQAGQPQPVPAPPSLGELVKPKIYVDEQGNPVEPPLVPTSALRDVERNMNEENYVEAIKILDKLLAQHSMTTAQRELALHRRADATFSLYEEELAQNYQAVTESSTAAINFNTKSLRNAAAYLRLGYTNLIAGNTYEAAGYFNLLRREFPNYENLALTYYYWGDYQYNQGNLNEAVEQFNYIVQNFPEHPISRDAALGLSRSYYRMGYFNESFNIMLFVEQRWPNFYLDYPPMLSMLGDVAYRVGNLDKARSAYWLYYNLVPEAADADMILSRLGDIYMAGKYNSAAVQVYTEAVKRFPSKDGGIISLMRLSEGGIYDDPIVTDMFKVFDRPYDQRPAEAYRTIIREYPGSPLVPLAKLKLSMWMLWQRDYITVLDLCSEVVADMPNSPLAPRAREVAMSAFTLLAAEDGADKRYARAREVWERYPILRTQEEFLDPDSRLALAVSQWNSGFQDEALKTLEPFFYGSKVGEVSEMALFLALNILTEHYRWEGIADLASRVELWQLTQQAQNQTDYALALANENMDKPEAAAPLWSRLYAAKMLPPTQMANTAFYLARSAERQRDLESAYYVGQDALGLLVDVASNDPERTDIEKIKTQLMSLVDIAESSGVLQQALEYAQQYLQYVNEGSLDQQAVIYRMARIHKKRGDTADWVRILEDLSSKYPNSVYGKTAKSELASYRLGNEAARFSNM